MKRTKQSTVGTSYHGVTIKTTIDKLVTAIGGPTKIQESEVIDLYWDCETEDGNVFSIYTFLEEDTDDEVIFRIGSFLKSVSNTAKEEVEALLK
jgi:hypothetical protein